MPFQRLFLYVVILGLLPIVFVGMSLTTQLEEWNAVEERLEQVQRDLASKEMKLAVNEAVQRHFKGTERDYLRRLEGMNFLEEEIAGLREALREHPGVVSEALKERLTCLTDGGNRLAFSQSEAQIYPHFQESLEVTSRSVEVNTTDLEKILDRLEKNEKRPHILISEFRLERKVQPNENETFHLTLKLLKREYL